LEQGCLAGIPGLLIYEVHYMNHRQINRLLPAALAVLAVAAITLVACTGQNSEKLVQAARQGDIETVKSLLDAGADVETRDSKYQSSLLMWAAHEGHTDVLNLLISNGAEIDARKPTGETALWFAAQRGQLATLEILARHGADINVTGWEGATALEVARKKGHQDVVDYLRSAGADG